MSTSADPAGPSAGRKILYYYEIVPILEEEEFSYTDARAMAAIHNQLSRSGESMPDSWQWFALEIPSNRWNVSAMLVELAAHVLVKQRGSNIISDSDRDSASKAKKRELAQEALETYRKARHSPSPDLRALFAQFREAFTNLRCLQGASNAQFA